MNTDQPLVSVLITNHNYERYLTQSIDSALNQTYPHKEIIVVDDGSTDDSQKTIASYQDKIIPIFKTNGGQASAINAGFAISRGEIVGFLDADDVWLPNKVEQVVEAVRNYPQASAIYHRVQNIDRNGTRIGEPWPPYKVVRGDISRQVTKTGGWWPFPPSTGLSFTRSFLSKVINIPEQEYRICADTYLADLAPFFGEVIGIEQALSLFRIHDTNNWSHPSDIQKRSLKYHELRVKMLNQTLKNLSINVEVSLDEHWPYQKLKQVLGQRQNLLSLSLLAWQNPWELRITSKLKAVVQLWLEKPKIKVSKL